MVYLGAVTVPRALPRLLRLPAPEGASEFAFLHDIVHAYSHRLYHGYEILSAPPFRVRSIVGRFLEHSRIFFFANGGQPEVYLGSADWMPRNLNECVEVMFRLKDPALCHQVSSSVIAPYLADTEKARLLLSDGTYARANHLRGAHRSRNGSRFSVQEYMIHRASEAEPAAQEDHGWPHILKTKTSPVFDVLSKEW